MNRIAIIVAILTFSACLGFSQQTMTPGRFRELAAASGDLVPLTPHLSPVPFWTNAVVNSVTTDAKGKVFKEAIPVTARTVGGKYIVFTLYSKFYQQPMNAILTFDEDASTLRDYGLSSDGHGGDMLIEATVTYDYTRQTYTMVSSYGGGFKEVTTGSYTQAEDSARTVIYKDGVLFQTRETMTRPVRVK